MVSGGWKDQLPMDVPEALVYRQRKLSALSTVKDGDVIYWNRAMNAIWAYSDRVIRIIQAVQNPDSPTAVTGTPLGTDSAAYTSQHIGVMTAIESARYSDGKRGIYTSRTAVVLATDGQTYRYENQAGLSAGSLVQAEAAAVSIYPQRLAGMSLNEGNVSYYHLSGAGGRLNAWC